MLESVKSVCFLVSMRQSAYLDDPHNTAADVEQ